MTGAKVSTLKKVNVYAKRIVEGTTYPPLYGLYRGLMMSSKDIEKCLKAGAEVYEIISDGKTVKLDLKNYRLNNRIADVVNKVAEISDEELEELTKPDNIEGTSSTGVLNEKSSFIYKSDGPSETKKD